MMVEIVVDQRYHVSDIMPTAKLFSLCHMTVPGKTNITILVLFECHHCSKLPTFLIGNHHLGSSINDITSKGEVEV